MHRGRDLRLAADITASCLCLSPSGSVSTEPDSQPTVIIVMPDDIDHGDFSCLGDLIIRASNVDAASEPVRSVRERPRQPAPPRSDRLSPETRGAKVTPYEGGTHVRAFWRWPTAIDVSALTAHIGVFPRSPRSSTLTSRRRLAAEPKAEASALSSRTSAPTGRS